ncbi:MAG: ribonuclease H-like domain-containing protein [Bacteroidetes bacterium]|nr:ribonuclease H-like domain-containing protein [Bacteroidota bacterium]
MELLKHILFIDIETASCVSCYDELNSNMQHHWDRKSRFFKNNQGGETSSSELFSEKAGIFSEFARVVSIGMGVLTDKDGEWKIILKAVSDADEKNLLTIFCEILSKLVKRCPDLRFCGHNIKEFDLPFLCRRMVIHDIDIPESMQTQGKKPWEVNHLDTLELWRFGDYKNFTSLALLADILGIPSPKVDIDGSMVSKVYWQEHNLERINQYCMNDVLTTARVFIRMKGIKHVNPLPHYISE